MATTSIYRTMGTATNRNIFTLSMWVKMSKTGNDMSAFQFCDFYVSADIRISIYHDPSDHLNCYMKGGGYDGNIFVTNAKYRDKTAWYHFVWRFDTTQATASDRVRVYVNGELATFSSTNYPSQNFNLQQGTSSYTQYIGRYGGNSDNHFDGIMSHVHFCDGQSYAPTVFGETDSTTGEWKIKTDVTATYGNNGFFILKDGNSVTDHSGNSLSFSTTGTLTKTEDNPSNVFATWNSMFPAGGSLNYDAGSTRLYNTGTAAYRTSVSTLGASTGKFYAEFKCEGDTFFTGVIDINNTKMGINDTTFGSSSNMTAYGYGIFNSTGNVSNNGSTVVSGYSAALANGDILGVALDATNKKLYFAKNGVWQNSGVPTSGSTGTGAISLASGDRTWVFASSVNGTNISANFGNGYFNETAVSSAGTNASGNGIFEYDVPTGFTALSTKGLNL